MHGRTLVKSPGMQVIEAREGRPIDELLRTLYVDEHLTQEQIAARLNTSIDSIRRWMARFDIETRYLGPRDQAAV
jgi:transposase